MCRLCVDCQRTAFSHSLDGLLLLSWFDLHKALAVSVGHSCSVNVVWLIELSREERSRTQMRRERTWYPRSGAAAAAAARWLMQAEGGPWAPCRGGESGDRSPRATNTDTDTLTCSFHSFNQECLYNLDEAFSASHSFQGGSSRSLFALGLHISVETKEKDHDSWLNLEF